jgi:hypothetical protein
MPARSELGPLWEQEPKTSGFRMSIPDPVSLLEWANKLASESGDLTQGQLVEKAETHLERELGKALAGGKVQKLLPNERVWEIDMYDELLSKIRVELSAGYSPESGEWAGLTCYVEFNKNIFSQNLHYHISSLTPEITEKLGEKGLFKCITERDNEENIIRVTSKQASPETVVGLFYESPEDSLKADPDDPIFQWSIVVYPKKVPLQLMDGLSSIQNFQHTISHFVDCLYEILQMEPPNTVFELSEETELL